MKKNKKNVLFLNYLHIYIYKWYNNNIDIKNYIFKLVEMFRI